MQYSYCPVVYMRVATEALINFRLQKHAQTIFLLYSFHKGHLPRFITVIIMNIDILLVRPRVTKGITKGMPVFRLLPLHQIALTLTSRVHKAISHASKDHHHEWQGSSMGSCHEGS